MLKLLKKLFCVIATSICLNGCAFFNSVSSYHDYTNERLEELYNFLNASRMDMTLYVILPDYHEEVPTLRLYGDEEMIMQEDYLNIGVGQIMTPTREYVSGDGFTAWTEADNSIYFNGEYVDYNKYINSASANSDGSALEFKLDYFKLSSDYNMNSFTSICEAGKRYSINLNYVTFVATFTGNKVTALSIAFKYTIPNVALTTVVISYVVEAYGESTVKRTIDFSYYYEVDAEAMEFIKHDIECYVSDEPTAKLQTKNCLFDATNNRPIPHDAQICRLYLDGNDSHPFYYYDINFTDVVYDETTGICLYNLAGKEFRFSLEHKDVAVITLKEFRSFPTIDHDKRSAIEHDMNNNRVLLQNGQKVLLFDYAKFETLEEYDVEGEINKISCNEGHYFISTVTYIPEGSYLSHKDSECTGKVYVIHSKTLEIEHIIDINTCPFAATIDKRGDIIISTNYGRRAPLYIYHPDDESIKTTIELPCDFSYGFHLRYDINQDSVVAFETGFHNYIFCYLDYENGEYVYRKTYSKSNPSSKLDEIELVLPNFILAGSSIIRIFGEGNYVCFNSGLPAVGYIIAFADNNHIYSAAANNGVFYFGKVDLNSQYYDAEMYYMEYYDWDIGFGFSVGDKVYLFDNTKKAFYTVEF